MGYTNRINDRIVSAVQEAFADMKSTADKLGIVKIVFSQHEGVDVPHAVFESGSDDKFMLQDIEELVFSKDWITVIGAGGWSGYLDGYYGDYFDVGQSIGEIYRAFFEVVDSGDICENEKA